MCKRRDSGSQTNMTVIADRHDCAIQMITIDSRLKNSLYFSIKRQFHRRASKVSQICNPVIKSNYARQKLVGIECKNVQKFAKFVKFQHGIDRSSSSNSFGGVMSFVSIQFESILSYRSSQLDTFRIDVSSYRPEEEISDRSGRFTSHRPRVTAVRQPNAITSHRSVVIDMGPMRSLGLRIDQER